MFETISTMAVLWSGLQKCIGCGMPCELACVLLFTEPPAVLPSSGCDVVKGIIDDKLQEAPSLCLQSK